MNSSHHVYNIMINLQLLIFSPEVYEIYEEIYEKIAIFSFYSGAGEYKICVLRGARDLIADSRWAPISWLKFGEKIIADLLIQFQKYILKSPITMRTVENLLIAVCYAREISTGSNISNKNKINIQFSSSRTLIYLQMEVRKRLVILKRKKRYRSLYRV